MNIYRLSMLSAIALLLGGALTLGLTKNTNEATVCSISYSSALSDIPHIKKEIRDLQKDIKELKSKIP